MDHIDGFSTALLACKIQIPNNHCTTTTLITLQQQLRGEISHFRSLTSAFLPPSCHNVLFTVAILYSNSSITTADQSFTFVKKRTPNRRQYTCFTVCYACPKCTSFFPKLNTLEGQLKLLDNFQCINVLLNRKQLHSFTPHDL